MNELRICAVQMDIFWEDYEKNLAKVEHYVKKHAQEAQVIVFPEMFLTGFSMNISKAIELNHEYIITLSKLSEKYNVSICGSLMIKENHQYYNRFLFFEPHRDVIFYDKRHLFRMANEHYKYTAGKTKIVFSKQAFRISPYICYDLRFPVWMRNVNNQYDICLVVANWPHSRIDAWNTLLKARAIENQCFVIGVNRTGTDGNNILYSGGTSIYNYKGNLIISASDFKEECIVASLLLEDLIQFRKSFPAFEDADKFHIFL